MRARSADLHAGARSCSTGIYLAIQACFLPVSTGTTGTQDWYPGLVPRTGIYSSYRTGTAVQLYGTGTV